MAAQELEAEQAVASVAGTTVEDLASQATAPSHVLDSESLLSQPSVPSTILEPEAEPEPDDVFGDAEPSDAPYEVPSFQEKPEPIKDSDKKKWKAHNAQRKKEKKDLVPFEVWLQNKKNQEERKKKAKFVAMMGGTISASRRVVVVSLHPNDSCPSHDDVGGLFFEFEANRRPRCSAQVRSRTRPRRRELSSTRQRRARRRMIVS
jgi:hypothetical protein